MEAKVDIRKLQLLNDRINQTIEALNQVRFSVHGLSHTGGMQGMGAAGVGGQIPGYGVGQGAYGFGGLPFGGAPYGALGGQFGGLGGMSHTAGMQGPWGYNPMQTIGQGFGQGIGQMLGVNPYLQAIAGQGFGGQGFGGQGGLSHTSPEVGQVGWLLQQQMQMDPYYGARVAQTFPFAQWPLSPVG